MNNPEATLALRPGKLSKLISLNYLVRILSGSSRPSKLLVCIPPLPCIPHVFLCRIDTNGDGNLSVAELFEMFVSLGYSVTLDKVSEVLRLVDADGNGNLSFKEFVALIILLNNEVQQENQHQDDNVDLRFIDIFNSVDTDRSGSISTSELGNLFSSEGYVTTEEQMQGLIAMVDTNNDGELNYEEFSRLMLMYLESLEQQA